MTTALVECDRGPEALKKQLVERGILIPTSTLGVWGKSAEFERAVSGIERMIDELGRDDAAEVLRFPPVIARSDFDRSEFMKSFPHLGGTIRAFSGSSSDHAALLGRIESGGDYASLLGETELALVPAACYPIYPHARGALPSKGRLFDVASQCFRHEPSRDPTRMVSFRMREQVRLGTARQSLAFREGWLGRADRFMDALELPFRIATAEDPFFGRGGRLLAASQRAGRLKFELLVPIVSGDHLTAVMSFNYHQDHFGRAFDIHSADGRPAHSACVGFGLDRLALALFAIHGTDPACWPSEVRAKLQWGC